MHGCISSFSVYWSIMSVSVPVQYSFDYYSFATCLEIRKYCVSNCATVAQDCYRQSVTISCFSMQVLEFIFIFVKNVLEIMRGLFGHFWTF